MIALTQEQLRWLVRWRFILSEGVFTGPEFLGFRYSVRQQENLWVVWCTHNNKRWPLIFTRTASLKEALHCARKLTHEKARAEHCRVRREERIVR